MILPLPRTSVPSSPTAPDPRDEDERPALILANLGTPAATHAQSRSVLPAGVPLRPPDRRDAPSPVATRPGRHHPAGAPSRIGGEVRHHLAPRRGDQPLRLPAHALRRATGRAAPAGARRIGPGAYRHALRAAGERLLLSLHSIARAMHDAGDPYRAECERTVEFLSRRLDLPEGLAQLTFSPSSDPLPGSGRPPSTRSASSAAPVAPALTSSAPVSSPTAWRLSRRSTSSTARPSPLPEAAAFTTSPGATTPTVPLPPWLSRPERYWPAGSEPGAARRPRYRIRPENRSQHERPQPLTGETDARDGMVTRTVQIL